ncbi:hypothetical protein HDK90DRAFT_530666 [Phyllosticta capitalensis]|uniref:Uncharacterized protein n=1 Tax=Phyllosticta capitalensis TaxID=121624 RepID=A0ABR1Z5A3_9PEZI
MKELSAERLASLSGSYESPEGYYRYIKSIPFLGELECNVESLTAGQWTEIIKGTLKFYSDWALFQTTHPELENYVSAEYVPRDLFPGQTPATVQGLNVRFDQKGHERPFQKAVIIDVVDGYMNPGDKIIVRLGDRRFGANGTRVQTLERDDVARALRARRTFATTGERLVGLAWVDGSECLQGDVVTRRKTHPSSLHYAFFGKSGFSSVEAYDASGCIMRRDFWQESSKEAPRSILRVTWGGARLYDRYREAVWEGSISVSGATIDRVEAFGGISFIPEGEEVKMVDAHIVTFSSRTSGDFDGANITTSNLSSETTITVRGALGGYVKVGDVVAGNPHAPQPTFSLSANWDDIARPGGKVLELVGGADLFVRVEAVPDVALPRRCEGTLAVGQGEVGEGERAVYFVAREWDDGKVVTSPVFLVDE